MGGKWRTFLLVSGLKKAARQFDVVAFPFWPTDETYTYLVTNPMTLCCAAEFAA